MGGFAGDMSSIWQERSANVDVARRLLHGPYLRESIARDSKGCKHLDTDE
jgi:hypothetical protein